MISRRSDTAELVLPHETNGGMHHDVIIYTRIWHRRFGRESVIGMDQLRANQDSRELKYILLTVVREKQMSIGEVTSVGCC